MRYPWFRLAIFIVGCLFPAWWLYEAATGLLGPDPGKIMMDRLGLGALIFLLGFLLYWFPFFKIDDAGQFAWSRMYW